MKGIRNPLTSSTLCGTLPYMEPTMKPIMKPYTVTFLKKGNPMVTERYVLFADGISDTHADSRAWIKFMETGFFRAAPDDWELETLEPVFNEEGEYVTA